MHKNACEIGNTEAGNVHSIWLGDFNRHHPYWDNLEDMCLFTREAVTTAEALIEAVVEAGLDMILPSGTPMHLHNVSKCWSRLDNVFMSDHSTDILLSCDMLPEQCGVCTDHLSVLTKLDLSAAVTPPKSTPNFREVDWQKFQTMVGIKLERSYPPTEISMQVQLDRACAELTSILQDAISFDVPKTTICTKTKRWWTKELTTPRREAKKLGRQTFKFRDKPFHYVHTAYKDANKLYHRTLQSTKMQHWWDWLEKVDNPDIWTIQKLLAALASDGGSSKIPTLKYKAGDTELKARSNEEKGCILAKNFFPMKPPPEPPIADTSYPSQCSKVGNITSKAIMRQICKLKPYKAPGPDGIPNIILINCADLLVDRLYHIYMAIFNKRLYYAPWKAFNIIVLCKLGKPSYKVVKAYQPIALINTLWKVLTAILAEQLTHCAEKHQLLLKHHFGGRPGHTTTDAMHLLTYKIKSAWRKGKVAVVLFLNIEGAFPNTVPSKLIHNMRKCRVPTELVKFAEGMLKDRVTTLKFDDYLSNPIPIDNDIG